MALNTMLESIGKSDIVKSAGLNLGAQFQSISIADVLIAITFAFLVGCIIALVYKKTFRGVLYSSTFPITLIMLTIITTPVVMCIKSDIALSMGMVGALSIVRFRTAVKDPMDTAYMFWALTMGILLGAGLYIIAIAVVLIISIFLFLISFLQFKRPNAYLLVIHCQPGAEGFIERDLKNKVKEHRLRSKTVTHAGAEITYEVRLAASEDQVIANLRDIPEVHDVTLVACQTDVGSN
ncbi:MAG: DUF4956 domain-containing protein [Christensenellaceae bacterium]|nr:DUF4956 domain-containing protein [Christensenellaceae bacterium]